MLDSNIDVVISRRIVQFLEPILNRPHFEATATGKADL